MKALTPMRSARASSDQCEQRLVLLMGRNRPSTLFAQKPLLQLTGELILGSRKHTFAAVKVAIVLQLNLSALSVWDVALTSSRRFPLVLS